MTVALSTPVPAGPPAAADSDPTETARRWLARHHDELVRRTRRLFRHRSPEQREEAVAEVLARTFAAAVGAARRGTLAALTPSTCVGFAGRQFRAGRRFAGSSSLCAMGEATCVRRGVRVVSLDGPADADADRPMTLGDALADRAADMPLEQVRRRHDYPAIFDRERLSPKARATFAFLAENRGIGRHRELAMTLRVTPGRITQLKAELAGALARYGYTGPLGPRPARA